MTQVERVDTVHHEGGHGWNPRRGSRVLSPGKGRSRDVPAECRAVTKTRGLDGSRIPAGPGGLTRSAPSGVPVH